MSGRALRRQIRLLFKQLWSEDSAGAARAESAIFDLGPDATPVLVELLRRCINYRRQLFLACVAQCIGAFVGTCIGLAAMGALNVLSVLIAVPISGAFGFYSNRVQLRKWRRGAANLLARLNDPRAIGPLLESIDAIDGNTYAQDDAVVRLLGQVREEDGHLLTAATRERLRVKLTGDDERLILALIPALERVADARFVEPIEMLAAGARYAAFNLKVRDAARASLPAIRARAECEAQRAILLRAAGPAEGDGLLRPSGGAGASSGDVLVRAANAVADE